MRLMRGVEMKKGGLILENLMSQKKDVSVDTVFVDNMLDILSVGKDDHAAIRFVLRLFGEHFHVQCVQIAEDILNSGLVCTAYWWENAACETEFKAPFDRMTRKTFIKYQEIFDEGLFYTEQQIELGPYEGNIKITLPPCLQCAVMEHGKCKGVISLYDTQSASRNWKKSEIDTFLICGKILSVYLLNLRLRERNEQNLWLDPLTGAWNLNKFTMEANAFLKQPHMRQYVVVYADIKKFKFINEAYGYAEGDRILIAFKELMTKFLAEDEMFARISSDHFLGLLRYNSKESLLERLKFFNDQLNKIPKKGAENYKIVVITGICLLDQGLNSITTMIDRANIARQAVKSYHKSTYNFYNVEVKQRIAKEKHIEDLMEDALQNGEFIVYYQPKIDLGSHVMVGAEALVRWRRPDNMIVPPDDFVPIFEKNGFIVEMDFYVFEQVCKKIREWLDLNVHVVPISVNFSRVHLNTISFVERLVEIVDRYRIPKGLLELELTESAFIENANALLKTFNRLKELKFLISLDDFGTGFSALKLLTELPVDVLKLDKDFLKKGQTTRREQIVLEHVVSMSQNLDIKVVSEGVETNEQADFLTKIGCHLAQGYLFARPMPIEEFEQRLKELSLKTSRESV